jgi:dTDP-4-dehydrorhamnose 3,5-epimerase
MEPERRNHGANKIHTRLGRKICYTNSRGKNSFMNFIETKLNGAYVIEPEKLEDDRGFFSRIWDKKMFKEKDLDSEILQSSISFNKKRGTLRGMHYQIKPYEESKLVRCTRGKIYDVIVDLRKYSKTFKKWDSVELSASNHKILYIPKGFAHGFQTLEDDSEVNYEMFQIFSPNHSRGFRWNDSTIKINWPLEITKISQKDSVFESFVE